MKILERITRRVASSASIAVTDTVKAEAKKVATEASPVIFSLAVVGIGLAIFRIATGKSILPKVGGLVPSASKVSVVTNNYFFDPAASAEFIRKVVEQ